MAGNDVPTELVDGGLLTVREAAELLGVSRGTIYSAMDEHETLAYTTLVPGGRRIPKMALYQWASRHMTNLDSYTSEASG